jgi:hypothetical protein
MMLVLYSSSNCKKFMTLLLAVARLMLHRNFTKSYWQIHSFDSNWA